MDRKAETKAVKKALQVVGINAQVGHGNGTAWGWLHIHLGDGSHFGEHGTHREIYPGMPQAADPDHCDRCWHVREQQRVALRIAQAVTGRRGEYDGRINVYAQRPIPQPGWRRQRVAA